MSAPVAEGMSHGGEDDVALVVRTLAGDRAAFGTLVQRYEEPVRRVARAVLHDVSDADDAAQDTFLTALMKLDRYDQRRPFRPWLLRIATNTAIDRRRHRALRLAAPLASDVSTSDPGPDVDRRPPGRRVGQGPAPRDGGARSHGGAARLGAC